MKIESYHNQTIKKPLGNQKDRESGFCMLMMMMQQEIPSFLPSFLSRQGAVGSKMRKHHAVN
jgi:hypothetical protein